MSDETAEGRRRRVGLIVPSSNVTMEHEVPAMLRQVDAVSFSFHASRMTMRSVSPTELAAMNAQGERCVDELADARCDVLAYACLVAVMAQGPGAHRRIEGELQQAARARGFDAPLVSSAGALVDTIARLGADRVAIVTPYVPSLTEDVVRYLAAERIAVTDQRSLGIPDNYEVGCIPGDRVQSAVAELDLSGADLLVLSACVQMPSLDIIGAVEARTGLPVITAATCTAAAILHSQGIDPAAVPGAAAGAWSIAA